MGYGRRQLRRSTRLATKATVRARFGRARKALVLAALAGFDGMREQVQAATGRRRDDEAETDARS